MREAEEQHHMIK